MRTIEQQLQEILRRAEITREKQALKKSVMMDAASVLICLLLLVGASVSLPRMAEISEPDISRYYGSLILHSTAIGYVVIGVLAFALGICVTLLCLHWRALNQKGRDLK